MQMLISIIKLSIIKNKKIHEKPKKTHRCIAEERENL